uniref:Uncharacterized protein n=1 Tax=Vespula pensylvanica TaxID=30213 RepID=A0A834NSF1_VESPE|nr:hypothetical protein H0235_011559 [Vespula pensylvanica]
MENVSKVRAYGRDPRTNFIFRARFDQVALNEETFVVSANYVPHIDYLLMHTDYIAKELVFATIPLAPDDFRIAIKDFLCPNPRLQSEIFQIFKYKVQSKKTFEGATIESDLIDIPCPDYARSLESYLQSWVRTTLIKPAMQLQEYNPSVG